MPFLSGGGISVYGPFHTRPAVYASDVPTLPGKLSTKVGSLGEPPAQPGNLQTPARGKSAFLLFVGFPKT